MRMFFFFDVYVIKADLWVSWLSEEPGGAGACLRYVVSLFSLTLLPLSCQ